MNPSEIISEEYFFSLVRPQAKKKMVKCLRCMKPFVSYASQRTCAMCQEVNSRKGALASLSRLLYYMEA